MLIALSNDFGSSGEPGAVLSTLLALVLAIPGALIGAVLLLQWVRLAVQLGAQSISAFAHPRVAGPLQGKSSRVTHADWRHQSTEAEENRVMRRPVAGGLILGTLLCGPLLVLVAEDAHAQIRVEGTVRWADGSPGSGLIVSVREFRMGAITDDTGRYVIENFIDRESPGRRVVIEVAMGKQIVGRGVAVLTHKTETIDVQLTGTRAAPKPVQGRPAQARAAPPSVTSSAPEPARSAEAPVVETSPGTPPAAGRTIVADGRDEDAVRASEEVNVTAELPMLSTSTEAGKVRLSPEQVAALPSLGTRDIFRALQLLPGVASNETSSGLAVRGGTPDQNLVAYDGFTVYSVDHLFGYFSAFNMDAVEAVELSKGHYDAQYGGRLSSLTEIRGRSNAQQVQGVIGASLLSADGAIEVPLGARSSLMFAGRQSYQTPLYDRILGLVNTSRAPMARQGPGGRFATAFSSEPESSFNDFNLRFDLRPGGRDQVALSGYLGNDGLDNSRELQLPAAFLERLASRGVALPDDFKITDVRDYGNVGASARWSRAWSGRVSTAATLSHSTYDTTTDRNSSVGGRQGATGEFNDIEDWTLKIDTPVQVSPSQELMVGVHHTTSRVRYGLANSQGAPSGPFGGAFAGQAGPLSSQLNRDTSGALTSAYAQHRMMFGNRLIATPGVRVTRFSTADDIAIEPRVSATFLATDRLRVKGAFGRYHQYINRLVREDVLQGNRDFWALADGTTIPVSSATNAAAGATYETRRTLLDLELFARDLTDISQLAPRVTGATDGVDLTQFFYQGRGKIHGMEALAQRKIGRHTGWASYTLSRVRYDFPDLGGTFLADHDRTHELKLVDTWQLARWTLSGTWIFSTGRPYTEPIGTTAVAFDTPVGTRTLEQIVTGDKNGLRLPSYHRLDAAASYNWRMGGDRKGTLGLSVFNAYNRQNVWYKEFTLVEGEVIENDITLMRLTLNAFFTLRF